MSAEESYAEETYDDVPVRPAATVMMLRDGADGLEAYVQRRVEQMVFGANATVFPGGGVDPEDSQPLPWRGRPMAWWAERFEADEPLIASVLSAAVREIFEETGVLLANVPDDVHGDSIEVQRHAILGGAPLAQALDALGAQARCDGLAPWARWITPPGLPRRYDTFFFVCAVEPGMVPRMVTTEAVEGGWIRPADALARRDEGSLFLMRPTEYQFEQLVKYDGVADVLATAQARQVRTVRLDTPTDY